MWKIIIHKWSKGNLLTFLLITLIQVQPRSTQLNKLLKCNKWICGIVLIYISNTEEVDSTFSPKKVQCPEVSGFNFVHSGVKMQKCIEGGQIYKHCFLT